MSWWVEREKSKCQSSDESIWKTYKMIYKNSYTNIKSLKCSKSWRVDESMWRPETLINDLQKNSHPTYPPRGATKRKGTHKHKEFDESMSRWVEESKSRCWWGEWLKITKAGPSQTRPKGQPWTSMHNNTNNTHTYHNLSGGVDEYLLGRVMVE